MILQLVFSADPRIGMVLPATPADRPVIDQRQIDKSRTSYPAVDFRFIEHGTVKPVLYTHILVFPDPLNVISDRM